MRIGMKRQERVWNDPPMEGESRVWVPKAFLIGAVILPLVLGVKEILWVALIPGALPSLEFLLVFAISPLLGGVLFTLSSWFWNEFWGEKT